jgi:hypothetical protein
MHARLKPRLIIPEGRASTPTIFTLCRTEQLLVLYREARYSSSAMRKLTLVLVSYVGTMETLVSGSDNMLFL